MYRATTQISRRPIGPRDSPVDVTQLVANLTGEASLAKNTGAGARPSREEIAALAYRFYEARERRHGADLDDWLRAERTLDHHYR